MIALPFKTPRDIEVAGQLLAALVREGVTFTAREVVVGELIIKFSGGF